MFFIMEVAERIIVFLPAWGCNVKGFPCGQVNTCSEDMDMRTTILIVMPDRCPSIAIRVQSGPGCVFH